MKKEKIFQEEKKVMKKKSSQLSLPQQ